jgi:hypothetical protein
MRSSAGQGAGSSMALEDLHVDGLADPHVEQAGEHGRDHDAPGREFEGASLRILDPVQFLAGRDSLQRLALLAPAVTQPGGHGAHRLGGLHAGQAGEVAGDLA